MRLRHFFDGHYFKILPHYVKSVFLDIKIGRRNLNGLYPTKYAEIGAYSTQSTDYTVLDRAFQRFELSEKDVIVDVGCGQGRILSYLLLCKVKCRFVGVEIDPDIAAFTRKRLEKYDNVVVLNGNILECFPQDGTVFYLFNPFDAHLFREFVFKIEKEIRHPIKMIYVNDLYCKGLERRKGWKILVEEVVERNYAPNMHYTIWEYNPNGEC